MQPPRRRPAATSAGTTAGRAGASSASASSPAVAARPSKLAREHKLSAQEESEIREAFSLFAEPMRGEKEGVIPIGDVRRALMYGPRFTPQPPPKKHLLPHLCPCLIFPPEFANQTRFAPSGEAKK